MSLWGLETGFAIILFDKMIAQGAIYDWFLDPFC